MKVRLAPLVETPIAGFVDGPAALRLASALQPPDKIAGVGR
jgi:hypothetical protein